MRKVCVSRGEKDGEIHSDSIDEDGWYGDDEELNSFECGGIHSIEEKCWLVNKDGEEAEFAENGSDLTKRL